MVKASTYIRTICSFSTEIIDLNLLKCVCYQLKTVWPEKKNHNSKINHLVF